MIYVASGVTTGGRHGKLWFVCCDTRMLSETQSGRTGGTGVAMGVSSSPVSLCNLANDVVGNSNAGAIVGLM